MAWIRLDDQIAHHPKFLKAGPTASWLFVGCLGYAQKFHTDGFIPENAIATLCGVDRAKTQAQRLIDAGLLETVDGGYAIHDYLDYNSSAAEIEADRKWDRFRKELYSNPGLVRAIKTRDQNRCRYCGAEVNWSDRRGPNGGQFDHVKPRGPNTLENIVVACRKCNCTKKARTPEAANMPLRPSSELDANQVGTGSDQVLRARASYPSHPIPSLNKKEQKKRTVASRLSTAGNGHRKPRDNQRVIMKLIHTLLDDPTQPTAFTDLLDVAKTACARKQIAYDSTVVGSALESAIAQRQARVS